MTNSTIADRQISGRQITGRHVLFMLVAFFGIIITTNVIFISLAVKSFPGESQKKSYVQGLQYNETLIARAEQARLGWHVQVTQVARTDAGVNIELRFLHDGDTALDGLNIEGVLRRSIHHREDQALIFTPVGNGIYRAIATNAAAGIWDVKAFAVDAQDQRFDFNARIVVP